MVMGEDYVLGWSWVKVVFQSDHGVRGVVRWSWISVVSYGVTGEAGVLRWSWMTPFHRMIMDEVDMS